MYGPFVRIYDTTQYHTNRMIGFFILRIDVSSFVYLNFMYEYVYVHIILRCIMINDTSARVIKIKNTIFFFIIRRIFTRV